MKTIQAVRITDIYSSIQGEGLYVGERHLFVRVHQCNLSCRFCDERKKDASAMTVDKVLSAIEHIEKESGPHAFIALTGGEPLCEVDFITDLCLSLRDRHFHILLETNGVCYEQILQVVDLVDVVSMDIKLSSVWNIDDCFQQHRNFLARIKDKKYYIKIVLSPQACPNEFMRYIGLVEQVNKMTPVFLQPLDTASHELPSSGKYLYEFQKDALQRLTTVRVIPQVHKILQVR